MDVPVSELAEDLLLEARAAASAEIVVSTSIEGITIRMSGDKRLLGVRIPPEILGSWTPEKLGKVLEVGINRARAIADYEAATFAMREMTANVRALQTEVPKDWQNDERGMGTPELIAGIRALLAERGWELAELGKRSGLGQQLLEELLAGIYFPLEVIKGDNGLKAVMDLACPLAQSFAVSPEELWRKGEARIAEVDRQKRGAIKRLLRGMKLHRRRRKPVDKSLESLKLGELIKLGVTTESHLELEILQENTLEMMRWRRDWLPRKRRPRMSDDAYGALLAPSGSVLRRAVSRQDFMRLTDLDDKAMAQPESITGDELEWARELLGIPTLELTSGVRPAAD